MTDKFTDKEGNELFAIVPLRLFASSKFGPAQKLIISVCIGTKNIVLENGRPFTHSVGSLVPMTKLSQKTISRRVRKLIDCGVMKSAGKLKNEENGAEYPIFIFKYDVMMDIIKAKDKMSIVKPNEIKE